MTRPDPQQCSPARRTVVAVTLAAVVLVGCGSGGGTDAPPDPQGPPRVQMDVVREHAAQFDDVLSDRPAGSQQEFAAATYILGHLQTAGYVPLLDPVPVEDAIRSTNVVAAPPRGGEPSVVVTVASDSEPGARKTGAALGLWLELARALYAREQEHQVEFVALGAENTTLNEGHLGSRRLVEFLRNDDLSPLVVSLGEISSESSAFVARGAGEDELAELAERLGVDTASAGPPDATAALFQRANLSYVALSGGADEVGRVLLELLAAGTHPSPF